MKIEAGNTCGYKTISSTPNISQSNPLKYEQEAGLQHKAANLILFNPYMLFIFWLFTESPHN